MRLLLYPMEKAVTSVGSTKPRHYIIATEDASLMNLDGSLIFSHPAILYTSCTPYELLLQDLLRSPDN